VQQFFGNIQNAFQQQIIPNILMMMKGRIQSQPTLLVQSTGGGKSAVPQTCGSTVPGVTIVIENTLALYADQVRKFDKVEAKGSHIFTIQLDQFKSRSKQQFVIDTINLLFVDRSNTNQPLNSSIFIFASPERLVSDKWLPTIQNILNILNNKCLSLLCVDEVHQFVKYGTTF
jgi:superfamily II DNA helicase RecQ